MNIADFIAGIEDMEYHDCPKMDESEQVVQLLKKLEPLELYTPQST